MNIESLAEKVIFDLQKLKGNNSKLVVVAMSGGVDSSLTALLYKKAGYNVIGVTLQLTNDIDSKIQTRKLKTCCAGIDISDARKCANSIGIDHYVIDMRKQFQKMIIDDFVNSYASGKTPVPCIRCNQYIKFDQLLNLAVKWKADYLATGHYVQRIMGKNGWELHAGIDQIKDQSYFLFALTNSQLEICHFPLGSFHKNQTRELARYFGLNVANKADSQDICFVPEGNYASLLNKKNPEIFKKGNIVDKNNNILAEHNGIAGFTIGQRKGLKIGGRTDNSEPLYVLGLEPKTAEVKVGKKSDLKVDKFFIENLNWLVSVPEKPIDVKIKFRARMEKVNAIVFPKLNDNLNQVEIMNSNLSSEASKNNQITGIAPGQACVFYSENRVIGGGWIVKK